MKRICFAIAMLCTLLVACKPEIEKPTVVTESVKNITETTADVVGKVVEDGGAEVTERGICWNTEGLPTIADLHKTEGAGVGSFTSYLTDLVSDETYYVRAYATNEAGTSYGDEKTFTPLGVDPEQPGEDPEIPEEPGDEPETPEIPEEPEESGINGHEYVDLGLPSGIKWATCNVGASVPEAYGDYYAWGETEVKNTYDFNNNSTWGSSVNNISGNATYDVARKKWGGSWRMPTNVEMDELASKCTWTWIANNGVNGYEITGPNGNSIFMPASGYHYGAELKLNGEGGYYWTSVPESDEAGGNFYAYYIVFLKDGTKEMSPTYRFIGLTVRPVSE